ncbi:hypothetical protein QCA50_004977 [Cerrena zonata]|uniref:Glucose-methanol-choline oxidoreductase N-terminal domain-containing protein n=1 Tax=Cerrena zonata TaxID=2478898 RepID=A0AAW0GMZ9_9APHY
MFSRSFPAVPLDKVNDEYDYIIVGGGTAGCVIANRLTAHTVHKKATVLVLELGGAYNEWPTTVPLLSQHMKHDPEAKRSSYWDSLPLKHGNGRSIELVSGKSLGGSSSINALLYTRGVPAEFNAWAAAGRKGWHYDDLQPYFMKSEHDLDQDPRHPPDFHGVSGEWRNRSHSTHFWGHSASIVKAASTMGVPYVEDLNSPLHPPHGCAKMHFIIDDQGKRSSTFTAFLSRDVAESRKDYLHICTFAQVQKIVTNKVSGEIVAEGVSVQAANGSGPSRFIRARREVILCSGAISSPHILLLRFVCLLTFLALSALKISFSGIGSAQQLSEHKIPLVKDLTGVGAHLQDHVGVPLGYHIPMQDSIAKFQLRPWTILVELFKYLFFGWGLFLNPVVELCIFIQTRLFDDGMKYMYPTPKDCDASLPENLPDIELMSIAWGDPVDCQPAKMGGFSFLIALLRPTSTGSVTLASSDPTAKPLVDLNYLATEQDMATLRKAIKFTRHLSSHVVAQGYPMLERNAPTSNKDEDLDVFIRRVSMTTSHYTSTCRMAPEAEGGVVDDELCVHGIRGLRVADASIFPNILGTHLMAPTVAVAEKCADMINATHLDRFVTAS